MKEDLALSGDKYEWVLTAFYITYIVIFPRSMDKLIRIS